MKRRSGAQEEVGAQGSAVSTLLTVPPCLASPGSAPPQPVLFLSWPCWEQLPGYSTAGTCLDTWHPWGAPLFRCVPLAGRKPLPYLPLEGSLQTRSCDHTVGRHPTNASARKPES